MYKITEESIKMLLWDIRIRQLLLYYWDTCKFFFFNCQEWHPSPKLRLKLSSPQKRWKQYEMRTVMPFPCCQHLATFALSISFCVGLSVLFLSADFKVSRRYQDISHLNASWERGVVPHEHSTTHTFHDAVPSEVRPYAAFPMYTEMASFAFSSCCEA